MRYNIPQSDRITHDALVRDYPQHTVEWIYANGWYDGPLDGMVCNDSGVSLYAEIVDEEDDGLRTYSLRILDPESAAYEAQKHDDFCKYVGSHWTFVGDVEHHKPNEGVKPQSEWNKFYGKYDWKNPRKPTGQIVGWFEG